MADVSLPERGAERERLVATSTSGRRHTRTTVEPPVKRGLASRAAREEREGRALQSEVEALLSGNAPSSLPYTGLSTRHRHGPLIRYRTDLDKAVIHFMFEQLPQPCEEVLVPSAAAASEDDDAREFSNTAVGNWHFFWMSVGRVRLIFATAELRLQDHQIINHFPNHYELTRKDLMYKNIKKYVKSFIGATAQQALVQHTACDWPTAAAFAGIGGSATSNGSLRYSTHHVRTYNFADFVPITYNLPNDMSMFMEEFKRHPGATWIVKPTSRSQGKGIFLINKLSQLAKWAKEKREVDTMSLQPTLTGGMGSGGPPCPNGMSAAHFNSLQGNFIVSRYIENPLLIGGKKFDMRLYVLVTSFKPLVAYLHEEGFARFCATKYNGSSVSEDDLGSHLTNVALQKGVEEYNTVHGGKWSLQNLFLYIQARHGAYVAESLMANIRFLIYHSLKAMEVIMFNDKHCFELYGYDILIDDAIQPHLIEVNASPSLSTTTLSDRLIKEKVLADMLKVVLPPGFPGGAGGKKCVPYWEHRVRTDRTTQLNTGFHLLQV